jgi:uncharacterized protein
MATATASEPELTKLLPGNLPGYTYIPGSSTPHPVRHPQGHSFGRKNRSAKPLSAESWQENRSYLLAIDLFNHGYYWEAHEEWDRLLRASGPESSVGRFLKGLVKMAAAGVKVREHSIHGVRRHAASAGEVFADVSADCENERFCGLELTQLQFAADRAAQLSYKERHAAGKPARVFPFILEPYPLPFA